MRWFVPLLILTSAAVTIPAYSQLIPGGPSGDFRVNDRPGNAPTAGLPGGPSLSPGPTMFQDTLGAKPPDDILKSIDKDLGRSMLERSGASSPSFNLERELRSPSDKFK
jgi:hypothetical protein